MTGFEQLIRIAAEKRASDLHISCGIPPTGRIDGKLIPITDIAMTPEMIWHVIEGIISPAQKEILKEYGEVDFAYSIDGVGRYRINAFNQQGTFAVAARLLNTYIPSPTELNLPSAIVGLTEKRRGLVLVTGATGSGKSTTLASLINEINQNSSRHVITLEDPIEYVHSHNRSIVNQRELGRDTLSFPNALRAALRQDPDVILVGEMRDMETISIAVTAAETGHLVFSTLHTTGAANTIDRIIDVFPPHQQPQIRIQLADVLEGVVSQQLMPRAMGYGRVAAFEVMLSNSAVRNNIREGKTYQIPSIMLTNANIGMRTMDEALFSLYQTGEITKETAIAYAQDVVALSKRIM